MPAVPTDDSFYCFGDLEHFEAQRILPRLEEEKIRFEIELDASSVARVSPVDADIRVTMPKVGESLGLSEETVPCSLVVIVSESGKTPQKKEITSLTRYSEFGFGRTQDYRGGDVFSLGRGACDIEVSSQAVCEAASARGATISLERDIGNPTDFYLRGLLLPYFARAVLCIGLLGVVICEFRKKKPNQAPEPTSGLTPGRGSS